MFVAECGYRGTEKCMGGDNMRRGIRMWLRVGTETAGCVWVWIIRGEG